MLSVDRVGDRRSWHDPHANFLENDRPAKKSCGEDGQTTPLEIVEVTELLLLRWDTQVKVQNQTVC